VARLTGAPRGLLHLPWLKDVPPNYDRGVAGRGAESISFTLCGGKKESRNSSGRMFFFKFVWLDGGRRNVRKEEDCGGFRREVGVAFLLGLSLICRELLLDISK